MDGIYQRENSYWNLSVDGVPRVACSGQNAREVDSGDGTPTEADNGDVDASNLLRGQAIVGVQIDQRKEARRRREFVVVGICIAVLLYVCEREVGLVLNCFAQPEVPDPF